MVTSLQQVYDALVRISACITSSVESEKSRGRLITGLKAFGDGVASEHPLAKQLL